MDDRIVVCVENEKRSEYFQLFLFDLGYSWSESGKKPSYTDSEYLVIYSKELGLKHCYGLKIKESFTTIDKFMRKWKMKKLS